MVSSNREVIERHAAALADAVLGGAYGPLDALRHPDFIEDWPQSREHIRGNANMRAIDEHRPNKPAAGSVEHLIRKR